MGLSLPARITLLATAQKQRDRAPGVRDWGGPPGLFRARASAQQNGEMRWSLPYTWSSCGVCTWQRSIRPSVDRMVTVM